MKHCSYSLMWQSRLFTPFSYSPLLTRSQEVVPRPERFATPFHHRLFSTTTTKDDDYDDVALQRVPAEEYLQSIIEAVDPSYRISLINDKQRKRMISCLLGYTGEKGLDEFNLKLRNLHLQEQWKKTIRFVTQDLAALQVDETNVPCFKEGLRRFTTVTTDSQDDYDHHHHSIKRMIRQSFSSLAKGKAYKAQLQLLLEDEAPHLLATYLDIMQEPNEIDLMRTMILEESSSSSNQWKDQLLELLEKDFGNHQKGVAVADDDIRNKEMGERRNKCGLQAEVNLTSYLEQEQQQRGNNNNNNNPNNNNEIVVLSNVNLQPHNKYWRRNLNNKAKRKNRPLLFNNRNIIFSNAHEQLQVDGMALEFDSIVMEYNSANANANANATVNNVNAVQIRELWEAKTKLNVPAISDMLLKKAPALQSILEDPATRLYFAPNNRIVHFFSNNHRNNNSTTRLKIGLYGRRLVHPSTAGRQVQYEQSQKLLEKSPEAVMQVLETGSVSSPPNVKPYLQTLLEEARRQQLVLVAPAY